MAYGMLCTEYDARLDRNLEGRGNCDLYWRHVETGEEQPYIVREWMNPVQYRGRCRTHPRRQCKTYNGYRTVDTAIRRIWYEHWVYDRGRRDWVPLLPPPATARSLWVAAAAVTR